MGLGAITSASMAGSFQIMGDRSKTGRLIEYHFYFE